MAARTPEEVKRELESERERLGDAVKTLRSQGESIVRRLPIVALGAAGTGLAVRMLRKRVFHRGASGREKRGRLPFLDRH
jgi:hypothetical protein